MAQNEGVYVTVERGDLPDPSSPWTLVESRFDATLEVADQMLLLLVGADGESGYLGEIKDSISTAPILPISATDIDVDDVDPTIDWTQSALSTDVYTDLLARLLSDLTVAATGLNSATETALHAQARARQLTNNDRAYQRILSDVAGRNFSMPSGALNSSLANHVIDAAAQDTEINNTILIENGRLSLDTTKHNKDMLVQLEQLIRTSKSALDVVTLDEAKASAQLVLSIYAEKTRVALANGQLTLEAAIANAKYSMEGYIAQGELSMQAAKFLAELVSQVLASAFAAVNANAGLSYSGSESKSENTSHSDNLSESHSYEHDPTS